jgi:signal transduction histidine kinase
VDRPAAEIGVIDTGIGIPPEHQRRIFERFCRVARPLHGDFSGSGLGLVLAEGIAERHNSTIQVQSSAGKGSHFWLALPGGIFEQKPQRLEDDQVIAHL